MSVIRETTMLPRPESADETDTVLAEAADLIDKVGWMQGGFCDYGSPSRAVDAAGAIRVVCSGHPDEPSPRAELAEARLARHLIGTGPLPFSGSFTPNPLDVITAWNDAAGRTTEQVTAAMRAAHRPLTLWRR